MSIFKTMRASASVLAAVVIAAPTISHAFDFTTQPRSEWNGSGGTVTKAPGFFRWTAPAPGTFGAGYVSWLLQPNQRYSFKVTTHSSLNGSASSEFDYFDKPADIWYGPSKDTFNNSVDASIYTFTSSENFPFISLYFAGSGNADYVQITGAPEIDGGKLPLAALLLGLVAVIAQRKRKAMLAAG